MKNDLNNHVDALRIAHKLSPTDKPVNQATELAPKSVLSECEATEATTDDINQL